MAQAAISEAAERYAAAAFELAQESSALDAIDNDLSAFADAIRENADLKRAVNLPLIPPEEKAKAFTAVARKMGLSDLGVKLIGVAAQNGRSKELLDIAAAFKRRLAVHRGQREVEIVSATPMGAAQLASLTKELSAALGADVKPTVRVDESLIGGFVVNAGSRQYDASVRTKLDSLKLALKA